MRQLAAVALMAAFVASGCGIVGRQLTQRGVPDQPGDPSRVGPAVVIGGAADAAGTWRAWVYRTNDGSICLSIESNENGSSGCSSDLEGITGMGRSSGGYVRLRQRRLPETPRDDRVDPVRRRQDRDGPARPHRGDPTGRPLLRGAATAELRGERHRHPRRRRECARDAGQSVRRSGQGPASGSLPLLRRGGRNRQPAAPASTVVEPPFGDGASNSAMKRTPTANTAVARIAIPAPTNSAVA